MPARRLGTILLSCVLLLGCDRTPSTPRVPPSAVMGSGSISGVVRFSGPKPQLKQIRNQPCCPGAPATLNSEEVIVNADGTLANVVVYLEREGEPLVDGSTLPAAHLDQKFCQYRPHVLALVVNQPLTITSSDPTPHNVNMYGENTDTKNLEFAYPSSPQTVSFDAAGVVHSKCDVHDWMHAEIMVLDTPHFAVTGTDGRFTIDHVPPGKYTLVTWQERYQFLRQSVEVTATPTTADFDYHPAQP